MSSIKIAGLSSISVRLVEVLKKNKLLMIALALGILLLLLPRNDSGKGRTETGESLEAPDFLLENEETRLEKALSGIEGVGKVSVTLTLESGAYRQIASDDGGDYREDDDGSYEKSSSRTTVKVQSGSAYQGAITLRYDYPVYRGALVVAEYKSPSVVLWITEAVSSLTGLSSDKITVVKGGV